MTKKRFINKLSTVFLFVFLVCAIGTVIYFTTGLKSVVNSVSRVYLSIDDTEIKEHDSGYMFDSKSSMIVNVKYDYDIDSSDNGNYTVRVVPNVIPEYDFDIVVDGKTYPYQLVPDLTAGFDIVKTTDSFTITPKGDLKTILSYTYPNSSIDDCTENAYKDMFSLVVTSPEGNSSVRIDFSVVKNAITFDKNSIIF